MALLTLWLWGFYLGRLVVLSPPLLLVFPDGLQARVPTDLIWTQKRITMCQLTKLLYFCLKDEFLTNYHGFFNFNVQQNQQITAAPDLKQKVHATVLQYFHKQCCFYSVLWSRWKSMSQNTSTACPGVASPFFSLRQMLLVVYTSVSSNIYNM